MQIELRLSADRHAQGQDMQAARINAIGHSIKKMTDLMMQRELRMESQMQEISSQIRKMGAVVKKHSLKDCP